MFLFPYKKGMFLFPYKKGMLNPGTGTDRIDRVSDRKNSSSAWTLFIHIFDHVSCTCSEHDFITGSGDQSIPEEDGSEGRNPAPDINKSDDSTVHESHRTTKLDWRTVRANFVARKKVLLVDTESPVQDGVFCESSKPLGLKWAHPIHEPETGCILVATEKLDGIRTFERTVVFLLRSGNEHPREGPFGVIINRPLHKNINDMKPTNRDLSTTFADCSLHFGGPLEASMFLLNTGEGLQISGFEEVIDGLCFGARNRLDEAAGLVKKGILRPQDFKFFVGYAGWQMDQLKEEIESGYWFLAACSADLIRGGSPGSSSEGLWEEILQLMGGHYAEVSKKPKQNS
ncbi:Protein of unknown function UPF0301 [Macleaya cordata]|uniref:Uncharacterized protein n=1 Tax=Macleaya cordata TaxID=56857 RepID=A0A200PPI8_MACCD|nr:Protein of unknown function UPF0301 [Macleaya cordata]